MNNSTDPDEEGTGAYYTFLDCLDEGPGDLEVTLELRDRARDLAEAEDEHYRDYGGYVGDGDDGDDAPVPASPAAPPRERVVLRTPARVAPAEPVELTDEQEAAVRHLLRFPRQVQSLGGYAGTGKTTVVRELSEPVIFVGDHGQLPPVADGVVNLMQAPDVTLETLHRNAGEVARFAEFVRQGNRPGWWPRSPGATGEQVRLARFRDLPAVPEQVICAFNRTRVGMNRRARIGLGLPPDRPVAGDRVICLQNSNVGVYNGMQGVIKSVEGEDRMVFATDDRDYEVRFLPGQFNSAERPQGRDPEGRLPFDYCYAITAHKSQGDEWDSVVVLEERCRKWDHTRWAYTAASRARQRLTWVEV
jgi:hypothetical protein